MYFGSNFLNKKIKELEETVEELKNQNGNSNSTNLLQSIYPIGAIYLSYESTNPKELFGFGEWVQLTDKFLRVANNTDTGGSDTVTLTAAQMPSHSHTFQKFAWRTTGNMDTGQPLVSATGGDWLGSSNSTNVAGSSQPFDNRPAYQNIYAWRRTA